MLPTMYTQPSDRHSVRCWLIRLRREALLADSALRVFLPRAVKCSRNNDTIPRRGSASKTVFLEREFGVVTAAVGHVMTSSGGTTRRLCARRRSWAQGGRVLLLHQAISGERGRPFGCLYPACGPFRTQTLPFPPGCVSPADMLPLGRRRRYCCVTG
jgi:hypothetical protein